MTPEEWSAASAVATVVVAVAAAVFAFVQVRQGRILREEQAAPYVIVALESSAIGVHELELVIKNIGSTPAFDIVIGIDPPMVRAEEVSGHPFMGARALSQPIKMLAPGQEIRLWFGRSERGQGLELASNFEAVVNGSNSQGRKLREGRFALDPHFGAGGLYPRINNLHTIGHRVERIDKSLGSIAKSLQRFADAKGRPNSERFADPTAFFAPSSDD
jgi:hypothetical protein